MTISAAVFLRVAGTVLATLLVAAAAVWGGFALWYQVPAGQLLRAMGIALWIALCIATLISLWQGRPVPALLVFACIFGALVLWWQRILPSGQRVWADDVAQMTTGVVDGNEIILHNVRNFDWRSNSDYTQRWETRRYQLNQLRSVDMIMSYWMGPAIAHMLISFGFADGERVVFSVEIRREKHESFSAIGGFFKKFELSIVAADERDVVRVRTNVRQEDDYLYRIRMPVSAMRSLFLAYIDDANRIAQTPRFYNTVTANCTTLVYHMMQQIVGHLPLNYRLLLSGYLPKYVYDIGGLDTRYSFAELSTRGRITERARKAARSQHFSADIRQGIPGPDELAIKNTE